MSHNPSANNTIWGLKMLRARRDWDEIVKPGVESDWPESQHDSW